MTVLKKRIVVALVLLLEIAAVLIFAKLMFPVQDGTSADFWKTACGVDLGAEAKDPKSGIYLPRDGWYIYYVQGYHGQFLFRVPRDVAVADYPEILQRIAQSGNEEGAAPVLRSAYKAIEQNRSQIEEDPEKLLSLLRDERKMGQYDVSVEQAFEERWIRIQRFWLNVVFEIVFFVSLTLFTFWPWLRNKGVRRTSLHVGLLPLLLFLPYYLGYSGWTFTSAGPSGGALYPWVIVWFGGFPIWTPVDQWVLETLPQVLEPLSQPLGPMLSITGGLPLGPVAALLTGLVVFVLTRATFGFLRSGSFLKQKSTDNAAQSPHRGSSEQIAEGDALNRTPKL